jgi:hypothetical protein
LLVFLFVFAVALGIVIGRYSAVSWMPSVPQSLVATALDSDGLEGSANQASRLC